MPCDIIYIWNQEYDKINLFTKQQQTHQCREYSCRQGRGGLGKGWIGSLVLADEKKKLK